MYHPRSEKTIRNIITYSKKHTITSPWKYTQNIYLQSHKFGIKSLCLWLTVAAQEGGLVFKCCTALFINLKLTSILANVLGRFPRPLQSTDYPRACTYCGGNAHMAGAMHTWRAQCTHAQLRIKGVSPVKHGRSK